MDRGKGQRRRSGGVSVLVAHAAYQASLAAVRSSKVDLFIVNQYRPGQPRRAGARRNGERQIALHLAMEAFGIRGCAISRAAGMHRSNASKAVRTVWERRDAEEALDGALWALTGSLRGE